MVPIFLLLNETLHKVFDIAPGGYIANNQDDQMETKIQTPQNPQGFQQNPKNPWTKNCLPKTPKMKIQA